MDKRPAVRLFQCRVGIDRAPSMMRGLDNIERSRPFGPLGSGFPCLRARGELLQVRESLRASVREFVRALKQLVQFLASAGFGMDVKVGGHLLRSHRGVRVYQKVESQGKPDREQRLRRMHDPGVTDRPAATNLGIRGLFVMRLGKVAKSAGKVMKLRGSEVVAHRQVPP